MKNPLRNRLLRITPLFLAALLLGSRSPQISYAQIKTIGMGGQSAGSTYFDATPQSQDWRFYPQYRLLQDFPALNSLAFGHYADKIEAIKRILQRAKISPVKTAALSADSQQVEMQSAVRMLAKQATDPPTPDSAGASKDLAKVLEQTADKRAMLRDLRLAIALLPVEEQKTLSLRIADAEKKTTAVFQKLSRELIQTALKSVESGLDPTWNGRTADVLLEGGAVLSFKRHSGEADIRNEGQKMDSAYLFGIDSPIPLQNKYGDYDVPSHLMPADFSKGKKDKARAPPCQSPPYLAYLKPESLAENYEAYINAKLPKNLTIQEKAERIEAAAFKAVDHMLLLFHNGYAHESLMGISHHGAHWEWDFWRWNQPFMGGMRYGPSFINSWRKGFNFPNIRLSGLADFEHIAFLLNSERQHNHPDHGGQVWHDAYSWAIGQNMTEFAFELLDAGKINKLPAEQTANIIWKAHKRFLTGVLPSEIVETLKEDDRIQALQSSARSYQLASRFGKIIGWGTLGIIATTSISILPISMFASIITFANALFSGWMSFNMFMAALSAGIIIASIPFVIFFFGTMGAGLVYLPNNLPGRAIHPLVMQVVKPSVELLRKHADLVGLKALSHPSGSPWDRRMAILFAVALPSAILMPAGIFAILGALVVHLLFLSGASASPMIAVYMALFGALLFPLRFLWTFLARFFK